MAAVIEPIVSEAIPLLTQILGEKFDLSLLSGEVADNINAIYETRAGFGLSAIPALTNYLNSLGHSTRPLFTPIGGTLPIRSSSSARNQLVSDIRTNYTNLGRDSIENIIDILNNENGDRSINDIIDEVEDINITGVGTPPESEDESDENAQLILNDINRNRAIKRFDLLDIPKSRWKKLIKFIGTAAVGGGITSQILKPYINALPKQEGSTIKIKQQEPPDLTHISPTVSEPQKAPDITHINPSKYTTPDYTISQLTGDDPLTGMPIKSDPTTGVVPTFQPQLPPPSGGYVDEIRPPIQRPEHRPNPTMNKKSILAGHAPRVVNYKKPITPSTIIPPVGPSIPLPIVNPMSPLNDTPIQPNGEIPQTNKFGPYKIGRLNKNYFTTKHNDLQWSQYVLGSTIRNMSLK